jgi:DNA replication protein DnaC
MEERKNSSDKNSKKIENFSAKILEGENDKHSEILSEAINDENIFNIALSGAYGSGKTSIIKTPATARFLSRGIHTNKK